MLHKVCNIHVSGAYRDPKKLCSIHSNGAPLLDENYSRIMIWRVPTANVQKIELIFKDSPGKPAQIADLTIHYSNL